MLGIDLQGTPARSCSPPPSPSALRCGERGGSELHLRKLDVAAPLSPSHRPRSKSEPQLNYGATVVACSSLIDMKKEFSIVFHKDRDLLKDKVDETQQWFPLKVEVGDLLEPRYSEGEAVPLPTLEATPAQLISQAAKETDKPKCAQDVFSKLLTRTEVVRILQDIVAALIYLIDLNMRDAVAGYNLVDLSVHPTVRERTLSTLSGDPDSPSGSSARGGEGAEGKRSSSFKRLLRRLDVGLRAGQLEEAEQAMGGLTPGAMRHLFDTRHVRFVPRGEVEANMKLFRKRISRNTGVLMLALPLAVRDLLALPFASCLSGASLRVFALVLKKVPLCDPKSPDFHDYVTRMVLFWVSGVPFSNASPPELTKLMRVWKPNPSKQLGSSQRGTESPEEDEAQRGGGKTQRRTPPQRGRSSHTPEVHRVFRYDWCCEVKIPNPPHNTPARVGAEAFKFFNTARRGDTPDGVGSGGRGGRSKYAPDPDEGWGGEARQTGPAYNVPHSTKRMWARRFRHVRSSGYADAGQRGGGGPKPEGGKPGAAAGHDTVSLRIEEAVAGGSDAGGAQHHSPRNSSQDVQTSPRPGGRMHRVPSILVPEDEGVPVVSAPPTPASVSGKTLFSALSMCSNVSARGRLRGKRRSSVALSPKARRGNAGLEFRSLLDEPAAELPQGFDEGRADVVQLLDDIAVASDKRRASPKKKDVVMSSTLEAGGRKGKSRGHVPLKNRAPFGLCAHSPYFTEWAKERGIAHAPPTGDRRKNGKLLWLMGQA